MSGGNKPAVRFYAATKDTDGDGKRRYTDLAAGWPMERDGVVQKGSYSMRMKPFGDIEDIYVVVVRADGTKEKISEDTHFFNLRDDGAGGGAAGKKGGGKKRAASDEDDFA